MKVDLKIEDLDERINKLLEEKIIEPLINNLVRVDFHTTLLKKSLQKAITEELKEKMTQSTMSFLDDFRTKNDLSHELSDIFNTQLERFISNSISDGFDKRFKRIDKMIENFKKEKESTDRELHKVFNQLHKFGNIEFQFIKAPEKPLDVEKFVMDKLREDNYRIMVSKFLKHGWRDLVIDWREIDKLHQIIDEKVTGAPDLIVRDREMVYFIEVKGKKDGIRSDQILWAKNHPDFLVKYVFVDWDDDGVEGCVIQKQGEGEGR